MFSKRLFVVIAIVVVLAGGTALLLSIQINTGIQASRIVYVSAVKGSSNSSLVKDGFQPKEILVIIGINNTVTWTNDDPGVIHTVHSDLPEFDSGFLDPGRAFTHTFTRSGTFTYHCDPHPWMVGKVIVKEK
ncbi:MAG: plastocyanin [Thaumarchaeota archaeon]|nr:plastocyanin [Nitrososphaerota archaeon]